MVVVMEETIRIRLSFEDDEEILSPSQKSEGLNRCWLLLKPQHHNTIADLTAHILHAFQLQHSCPHGLYLYMDGFALPPFESTGILKNSEMISVRKKTATLSIEGNLNGQEAGVTQPVKAGTLLLANTEFQEETGGYLSDELEYEYRVPEDKEEADKYAGKDQLRGLEEGGNATSKKRKAPANPHKSKKKKKRSALPDSVQDDATANQVLKSSQDKVRSSQENIQKQEHNPKNKKQAKNGKDKIIDSNMEISADTKSSDEIQNSADDALEGPVVTKKISRSARRKKAKRQWLRELVKVEKQNEIVQNGLQYSKETLTLTKVDDNSQPKSYQREEQTQPKSGRKNRKGKRNDAEPKGLLHWKPSSAKDKLDDKRKNGEADQNGSIHEQANQHSNTEDEVVPAVVRPELNQCNNQQSVTDDEIVPVVIRPGHIRFEPSEKDEDVEQSKKSRDHFIQWNGITNKKKGQKWGKEKHVHSNSNRKDYYETQELDPEVLTIEDQMEEVETEALTEQDQADKVVAEVLSAHNELHFDNTIDFDKLPPLCNLPKAGDVIVYRLLELSSSWTPELSPFRVGKVSWCSSETGKLLLMPVPEYPISSGMSVDDESGSQPDNSLYNEDGSLEIDFTALVDVRLLKDGSGGLTTSAEKASGFPVDAAAALAVPSGSNDTQSNVSTKNGETQPGKLKNGSSTENGVVDIWEQVNEALKAKKAELSQERTENTWSYKTIKSSALGPTMALLRSSNKL